jgi:hypothetical protein
MNDNLKNKLTSVGFKEDQISKLEIAEVVEESDLALFSSDEILAMSGCSPVAAKKIYLALHPAPVVAATPVAPTTPPAPAVNIEAEIPEGAKPTTAHINQFANTLGMDSGLLTMLLLGGMTGNGGISGGMDLSGLIPVSQIVAGYNPKVRNMYLMLMTSLEDNLGVPIVVINEDGSIHREHTTQYILDLQDNLPSAEENVYLDRDGLPFDIIKVGIDAQGIFDADPLDSTRSLSRNLVGLGRISWNGVSLDVRQVCYFAVTKTGEIKPDNNADITWLRDHIKPGCDMREPPLRRLFRGLRVHSGLGHGPSPRPKR